MPEKLRFDDRVVIVTGAGAGLGRAYALLFGSRGAKVVVNDLGSNRHGGGASSNVADTVVAEIRQSGGKAVANYDSVLNGDKIVKTAIDAFGRIDIIVNNAGILRDKSIANMSDDDWDIIHDVHVKGAFKTTRAAWPYFRKQNYGRVIVTASLSGLYGNFGQANYSAAKMALIGLANTLAIEGGKYNINTNVIVPTAGSRLTEDVLPPDFHTLLKPELIAPIVLWLCHDDCKESGSIIEAAMGWAGKYHLVRASGCVLRQNITDSVTPEDVRNNWTTVTDMTDAKHYNSIQEVTAELFNVAERLRNGQQTPEHIYRHSYTFRDTILYALGVGATLDEPSDICYLYENHENFAVHPMFYTTDGPVGAMATNMLHNVIPKIELDPTMAVHGEQYLEVHNQIPTDATVETRFTVQDVMDKGKGAIILLHCETYDLKSGNKLTTGQMSIYVNGAGGFGGPRTSKYVIPPIDPPKSKPEKSVTQKTSVNQAAWFRLNGDINPLHIDPIIAHLSGFKKPILHGLSSLGFAVRHILQAYANGNPNLFKSIKVRFSKPVYPGQTLRTDMWRNENRIHFQTIVTENNSAVITGGYADLKAIEIQHIVPNPQSAKVSLESDAVFAVMSDYVKSNQDEVKKINGVFHYIITSNGEPKSWTLDLKKAEIYEGKPKSGTPDTTLTVDDKHMVEIALGKLNPQVAFMQGKLKIKGNIMLTQKLKTLIDANKSKL
ncbi:peroxisomal multifunctional enzyme type 2 [Orussus abietinus]|uniref:peroxisomal multifunctional enzyme type 2 n=1 Tax=Orussus abietinus TaxID=222816 RepID=UPI000626900D|nr:peroxisomal multifunctional enzyme type 2 [Orussus abietinus]XP_023287535.1 peroxisomal multifunctional enzyme type 2 [Orussus abietinus]